MQYSERSRTSAGKYIELLHFNYFSFSNIDAFIIHVLLKFSHHRADDGYIFLFKTKSRLNLQCYMLLLLLLYLK